MLEAIGGSHYQVTSDSNYKEENKKYREKTGQAKYESHHIYGWAVYREVIPVNRDNGPAIRMDKPDHQELTSTDHNPGSREYREKQQNFLKQEKFREAWMMDVKDIRTKFGSKYNIHLAQAEKQLLTLDKENKIKLENSFKKEIHERQKILSSLEKTKNKQKEKPSTVTVNEKLYNSQLSKLDQHYEKTAKAKKTNKQQILEVIPKHQKTTQTKFDDGTKLEVNREAKNKTSQKNQQDKPKLEKNKEINDKLKDVNSRLETAKRKPKFKRQDKTR